MIVMYAVWKCYKPVAKDVVEMSQSWPHNHTSQPLRDTGRKISETLVCGEKQHHIETVWN